MGRCIRPALTVERVPLLVYNRLAMERESKHNLEPASMAAPSRCVDYRLVKLVAAFRYAFQGLWYMLRTQRNAQIHCLVGACAVALAVALRVERWEWTALLLTITLVLAAEGANTAVEAAVDLATSARHPLAKVAKDVAAGTVLLCAIASVVVGCLIFLPHLWPVLMGLLGR
jgi:diacylglycerol kinase (ATP)